MALGSRSKGGAKGFGGDQLMERVAAGDRDAMAQLYDSTSSAVFGLALRIVGDRHTAEEVAVDVYAEVWRRAASFESTRGSLSGWLLTITRTRSIDVVRRRRRNAATEPLEAAGAIASRAPTPEDDALALERHRLVQGALRKLAPEQLEAIQLAYFKDLSHGEIARQLGQPLGTVKTRIRLGMLRLRELLGPMPAPLPMAKRKTG